MPDVAIRSIGAERVLPIRHQVLRPHQTIQDCAFPGDDALDTMHAGAFAGDELVAVASIFRDPLPGESNRDHWRIRGMATLPKFRGRTLGSRLLGACMDHATARGARLVWCNARTGAKAFYERHGFVARGDEFDLPKIGPHYLMIREL